MWPTITDKVTARSTAQWGFYASMLVCIVTVLFSLLGVLLSRWALVDAALFGIAAWHIRRMSRSWSVIALILYLFEIEATLIVLYALVSGVRGTISYHRYSKTSETSSLPAA